ncbi:MAG: aminotransferase class I/II-fold pyridoxal phosphate-dependent enzyme [Rhizobiales bacterium]|nr:aminotransferase class I/II-fold pyridoxal phosphate-dependent enzyme [Hyphomicrobiales bacterium]MBO6697541.1 aminotransferase class I/II-fold pyridoxal phosphate-dependent enzyme [Hyphomicrobiales bacterium]MBO6736204.1 aminotransferase class I/II-fold pyridoxal phosphate-dependent enzyme [Hyphomicrobiales bacterium]MBO6912674.1 aminotransferase class I/II-fold pyridoxal phosphate-dependent enzyme [Hyphomicrobiales bacterium]MBO6956407.1 aminotransferase class I/II-fold pyridoxal phosphate
MGLPPFRGSFTQQEPIPDEGIAAAVEVMQSGRLHRYNVLAGEESETVGLERDYAAWQGSDYCLAVASGGQAMQIALRAAGVKPGDKVLTNAFTLAPVPGAIAGVGAEPVLVEITEDLVIDLDDLRAKAEGLGAKVLMLSNMRGHLCDMDALMALAASLDITVLEDCAHTMGASWRGKKSGRFGLAGCFSSQTYKHINSGEGGLITSSDDAFMARAIMLSGSYMMFDRHGAGPSADVYADIKLDTPNISARMDNLRAAILRPQLAKLDDAIARWNDRYRTVEAGLAQSDIFHLPQRPSEEFFVGSSIQFMMPGLEAAAARAFLRDTAERGVDLKWFGDANPVAFTSAHPSWRYVPRQHLPQTDRVLAGLFDMRLPLTFSLADCELIAAHIVEAANALVANA